MNGEMRNRQKEPNKIPHGVASNKQHEMPGGQNVIGLPDKVQKDFRTEEPVIDLATDFRKENQNPEHIIGLSAVNGPTAVAPIQACGLHSVREPSESREDCEEIGSVHFLDSTLIEKLSEENLQLFMRRGELQRKEEELKKTIEELECKLEEARRKCSQLASQLEIRRKQQVSG